MTKTSLRLAAIALAVTLTVPAFAQDGKLSDKAIKTKTQELANALGKKLSQGERNIQSFTSELETLEGLIRQAAQPKGDAVASVKLLVASLYLECGEDAKGIQRYRAFVKERGNDKWSGIALHTIAKYAFVNLNLEQMTEARKQAEELGVDKRLLGAIRAMHRVLEAQVLSRKGDTDALRKAIETARAEGAGEAELERMKLELVRADFANGKVCPDFEYTDPDGKTGKLSDHRGAPVLVVFWASWAGPFVRALPNLERTYKRFAPKGFKILAISVDRSVEECVEFLGKDEAKPMKDWIIACSGQGWDDPIAKRFSVGVVPISYLVDGDGKIVARDVLGGRLRDTLKDLFERPETGNAKPAAPKDGAKDAPKETPKETPKEAGPDQDAPGDEPDEKKGG